MVCVAGVALQIGLEPDAYGAVLVTAIAACFRRSARMNRSTDAQWIDGAFDKGCEELVTSGGVLAWLQMGRTSGYLRSMALGLLILAALALVVGVAIGQVRL